MTPFLADGRKNMKTSQSVTKSENSCLGQPG